ncbi:MAG: site-specific DNA-methyltransferase [Ignavibacteria bacterium CG_4_9_14_3_um_filter_36_18]|nr:MAG: site-specific DNA-methyltransferase [Ignavibacteria bacterium CG_4_9_14_3_um_filter_36_18]
MAVKKPTQYNISPAKGQALLNFQGRRFPDKVELFETFVIEQVRQNENAPKLKLDKQTELNADFTNLLIHGDCLSACAYLKSKNIKVDLVYIDPPFASGANYAKKIYLRNGAKTEFENEDNSIGEEIMYGDIWQKEDYLNWLYERLLAIREVMSETASIYVHLDWHIGHYVKILLDEVFGEEGFKNDIIWHYRTGNLAEKIFQRKHDIIYFYTKNEEYLFKSQEIKEYYFCLYGPNFKSSFKGRKEGEDKYGKYRISQLDDVWDISGVFTLSNEHTDYNTQKPEALVRRIIESSSNEGLIVADFFIGSGTTAKVANDLGRKFIACDIGVNAVQTTRDRLVEAKADFDLLKVNDGVRLFRNPAQTQQKIFSLIDGFKNRTELELGEFWDGGIAASSGSYVPVKFVGIQEKLTKQLLDFFLEQIYDLEAEDNVDAVKIIYAYKDLKIDKKYLEKALRDSKRTTIRVELTSLDDLLGAKRDLLFPPENADIEVKKEKDKYKVVIKRYFSSYLKTKIDDFNAKKVKKQKEIFEEDGKETEKQTAKKITLSKTGLELIESVQFDTALRKDGIWESNLDLEDKAGIKDKIKGTYILPTNKFKIKIRNIAGDEFIEEHI